MFRKISLRMRLTLMITVLLAFSCIILTITLNYLASKMASQIQLSSTYPSIKDSWTHNPPMDLFVLEEYITPVADSTPAQIAETNYYIVSIIYMILVIISGGILTYYVSGRSLMPVKILSQQIKNLTIHNLSKEIDIPDSNDEIAELAKSFNDMTRKLDSVFANQKRFSASAAHELRTPLTVLQTKVEVFKKRNNHTPSEYDSLIETISTHTKRLSDLVKDLLDMTYMDELQLKQSINLYEMLEDVIYSLDDIAENKNIKLTLSGDNAVVYGNYQLLSRGFYNLVEKGIKNNHIGGFVSIQVIVLANKVTVTVSDSGIGIAPEFHSHIFEAFYRIDKSRSRNMGGAGLGLSIAKNIIDRHQGEISVKNNTPLGTCFNVTLSL
ncbi:MAG: HAMP domain-containing sensor histidine kinase [Clostridium sp.]